MNHFIAPYLFISPRTKKMGLALINDLFITRTSPSAFYLGVNSCYDGHEAVFIWLEHYLENNHDAEFDDIKQKILTYFPEYS